MLLTPGTRLGPYTIESLIGSGGMGEVYKAHDERLNRTVAIKRLIADDASRFQREARAIAAINHPHICQIYDVGPDYLVLEYRWYIASPTDAGSSASYSSGGSGSSGSSGLAAGGVDARVSAGRVACTVDAGVVADAEDDSEDFEQDESAPSRQTPTTLATHLQFLLAICAGRMRPIEPPICQTRAQRGSRPPSERRQPQTCRVRRDRSLPQFASGQDHSARRNVQAGADPLAA